MKNKRVQLNRSFYTRDTIIVAKELLGKYIVRKIGKKTLAGKIIETEAYIGPKDKASHAYNGKITPRNKVEYLAGGYIYIYLVYGMYWQLNVVTAGAGKPECALIRAMDLGRLTDGPGKVCRYLKLNKSFYGEDLTESKRIWLENPAPEQARCGASRGENGARSKIIATKRIGIDYAGHYWSRRKWRFVLKT
jgi:DNA-3-methyladenine glycosylase